MDELAHNNSIRNIGFITALAGAVVMAGWLLNMPALESIIPGFVAMRFNAGLCFVLFGLALALTQYASSRTNNFAYYLFSGLATAIGLFTILQDIFHFNSGLDQFFVTDPAVASYSIPFPGRMAFNASASVVFVGGGFLTLRIKNSRWILFAQLMFHAVSIFAAVSLIGYLYGVSFFRVFLFKTSMAVHTALLFLLLSGAASLLHPNAGITRLFTGEKVGNQMARRLFGLMLLMVILFGSLRIQTQRFGVFASMDVGISILAVCFLLVSLLLIWNTANWLNSIDKRRTEAEEEVRRMNNDLEKLVEKRYAEFQKSEEKYHSLVEQASDAIFIVDSEGNFIDANASMCKMVGYSKEELLKMSVAAILTTDELETNPLAEQMRVIEYAVVRERNYVRKNGEVFPAEINVKKVADGRILIIARDITYRKKIEAELRDAELRFRTIADKSMVGVYIVQHGKFVYVNPRFAAIFGYRPEELINTFPVDVVFHESFKATANENVQKRIKGEVESVHYEAMGLRKDGSTNWVEFYGSRAVLNDIPTILGSMIEITERKKAEEELKSSEQKYRLIFDSNPTPMWMIAKKDRSIIAVNDAAAQLYGYTRDEMMQTNLLDLRPEEDRDQQIKGYEATASAESAPVTVRHYKKDGTLMYVQITARDIVFEGQPVRLSMTLDVTEKLKAEESLRKSEANLQTILKTTDTAYVLFDTDFKMLAFNQTAEDFVKTQYKRTPSKGEHLSGYLSSIRFPKFSDYANEALKGKSFTYEISYPQAGGVTLWYYVKLVPITNDKKEILGVLVAFYDITERKAAEQHLQDAYNRIEEHIDSIKEMAWKQSHLIRSPLANLKGLLSLLKDDPKEKGIFEHIEKELNRMDAILIEMAQDASYHD